MAVIQMSIYCLNILSLCFFACGIYNKKKKTKKLVDLFCCFFFFKDVIGPRQGKLVGLAFLCCFTILKIISCCFLPKT